jgi:hypothetical protein
VQMLRIKKFILMYFQAKNIFKSKFDKDSNPEPLITIIQLTGTFWFQAEKFLLHFYRFLWVASLS